jgi:hypothetical protein
LNVFLYSENKKIYQLGLIREKTSATAENLK